MKFNNAQKEKQGGGGAATAVRTWNSHFIIFFNFCRSNSLRHHVELNQKLSLCDAT
uniref:Uncharacterized protein n=1 Tax=Kalanchoe fedtschenkoi TaxID=63787 RepID=A0A7N0TBR6_KALFE